MLTYWLIDSFLLSISMTGCLSRETIFAVYLLFQAKIVYCKQWLQHFFLLTPLIILILRKLFMQEMFEFWLYVFSLVICLGCGWWLFGDGLYFAISKVYESRFNGSHRQRSYQLTFASNPPCSAFPNSTFMSCSLAIRWTIDSPSPLPVAVCPGGR